LAAVVVEQGPDGKDHATLVPCECWGKKAEAAGEYEVGQLVLFEGKLRKRQKGEQWELVVSGFELTPVLTPTAALTGTSNGRARGGSVHMPDPYNECYAAFLKDHPEELAGVRMVTSAGERQLMMTPATLCRFIAWALGMGLVGNVEKALGGLKKRPPGCHPSPIITPLASRTTLPWKPYPLDSEGATRGFLAQEIEVTAAVTSILHG
jgi:hypothetical protein